MGQKRPSQPLNVTSGLPRSTDIIIPAQLGCFRATGGAGSLIQINVTSQGVTIYAVGLGATHLGDRQC